MELMVLVWRRSEVMRPSYNRGSGMKLRVWNDSRFKGG